MLDEIKEQPHILERWLRRFFRDDFSINCDIPLSDEEIRGISDITVVASGSSKNVGDVAASYFRRLLNIPVRVEFSSEFCVENSFISKDSFVIAISQSGETTDTYEALEAASGKTKYTLALTNNSESRLHHASAYQIMIEADKEKSIAATKTVTAQLLCLMAFGLFFASKLGVDKLSIKKTISELKKLPEGIETILENCGDIQKIAENINNSSGILFVSKGSCVNALREGALKLKETSYIMTEVLPSGEALHGHFALLDNTRTLVSAILDGVFYDTEVENTLYMKEKSGANLVVIKNAQNKDIENKFEKDRTYFINIPSSEEYVGVFYIIVVCQLLAYYISLSLGFDTNHPRYLSKVVK